MRKITRKILLFMLIVPSLSFGLEAVSQSDIEKLNTYCMRVKQAFFSLSVQDLSSIEAKQTLGDSNIKYIQPNLTPYLENFKKLGANECSFN